MTYRFNVIPTKIQKREIHPKIHVKSQVVPISQNKFEKEQRPMDWNTESKNKHSHIWSNDFQQGAKILNGERTPFQQMCWENWISTRKGTKLDPYLTTYTKLIKDLNIRATAIKPL